MCENKYEVSLKKIFTYDVVANPGFTSATFYKNEIKSERRIKTINKIWHTKNQKSS
jgi:hypothetical protein